VLSPLDAIEPPLSVLEAAATDLALVCTPFGALPEIFPREDAGVAWAETKEAMVDAVKMISARTGGGSGGRAGTRRFVETLSWDAVAADVLGALERPGAGRRG